MTDPTFVSFNIVAYLIPTYEINHWNLCPPSEGRYVRSGPEAYNWLYVETDQSHGTKVKWGSDPAQEVK